MTKRDEEGERAGEGEPWSRIQDDRFLFLFPFPFLVVGAVSGDLVPVLLILAALAAFVAVATYRLRARMRARGARPPLPPIDVPPNEVELREGPIQACMHCGATSVRPAAFSEGGIPGAGAMLFYICARCGHRGPPLEFEDATAWREFVKGLNEKATVPSGE